MTWDAARAFAYCSSTLCAVGGAVGWSQAKKQVRVQGFKLFEPSCPPDGKGVAPHTPQFKSRFRVYVLVRLFAGVGVGGLVCAR